MTKGMRYTEEFDPTPLFIWTSNEKCLQVETFPRERVMVSRLR